MLGAGKNGTRLVDRHGIRTYIVEGVGMALGLRRDSQEEALVWALARYFTSATGRSTAPWGPAYVQSAALAVRIERLVLGMCTGERIRESCLLGNLARTRIMARAEALGLANFHLLKGTYPMPESTNRGFVTAQLEELHSCAVPASPHPVTDYHFGLRLAA